MNENFKTAHSTKKEWYKHGWGLVAAILLLPFFIIWYAWAKSNWSKNVKIGVTVASVIFIGVAVGSSPKTEQTSQQPVQQTQAKQEEQKQEPQTPKPTAKYEGNIVSYDAINPASLRFVAEVKNTGDGEGKFSCTVRGKDASSTYTGFDIFEDEGGTLKPGETRTFNGVITIKKEGAYYVSDVSISCN